MEISIICLVLLKDAVLKILKVLQRDTKNTTKTRLPPMSASKISKMYSVTLLLCMKNLCFSYLKCLLNPIKKKTVSSGVVEEFHKDVYYIDGCSAEECVYLLETYGELLINDGLCSFGFGCHNSGDEIMLGKYNLISIYSKNLAAFEGFFEAHKIENNDNLVLAGSVISRDNPGTSKALTVDGLRIYDLPERLNDWNIYLAETRAE